MSARAVERALRRLAQPDARLALARCGVKFGVYDHGDLRRRPTVTLTRAQVRGLVDGGLIVRQADGAYRLSDLGHAPKGLSLEPGRLAHPLECA